MRKTLLSLTFGLLLCAVPAYAQHGHGGGHGGGGGRQGGGHEQHGGGGRVEGPRGGVNGHGGHFDGDRGHHTNSEEARHFDGRRFDRDFHGRYFGRNHIFIVDRPVFIGGGYRFWYGGFWFSYYEPWPADWCYCDGAYIDYDPALDCYFLYNPVHPGFRLRLGVVF